nr:hypothetical protein [Tanacetum cinerariifolium]
MDLYYSPLTHDDLDDLIINYKIPRDLHPRLPSKEFVMVELSDDAIGIYHRMFDFSGIRIPFSSFLLALIKHYRVHFSQLDPLDDMVWRHPDAAIDDLRPAAGSFSMADVRQAVFVIWYFGVPMKMLWAFMIFSAFPSRPRKASTSGATSSHVAKRTTSALAQSSGRSTRPSLFVGDSDDESDGDDDACVEIPLVTRLRSAAVIPSSGNQVRSSTALTVEDSRGKGIMADDAAASFVGVSRPRQSSGHVPSFRDVSGDAIHANFFLFYVVPYYATYAQDGDPAICKTVVDQFHTPGEMVRVEALFEDRLTANMSVSHCMMMSHGGELLARYRSLLQSHHEVQGEILSLVASAGSERGLSMHQTKDEFSTMLKKMANFMPDAQDRLAEASSLVARTDYAFLNKIYKRATEPLSDLTVAPASKSLDLSANVVLTAFAVASEHNEEMVNAEVDGSDPKMTDDTIAAKSGHAFMQGIYIALEGAVQLVEVGSGYASSVPNDVVVSLFVGEKGDGVVPSFFAGEKAAANSSGFRLSFSFLPFSFFVSLFSVREGAHGMPENTCCSKLGAN